MLKKSLFMLLIFALLLLPVFASENTVYVSDGGSGDGSSAGMPLGTLAEAYAALGNAGGNIVIVDTCTLSANFTEPAHSGKVTISGGKLSVGNIRYVLNGATTFTNINIHGSGKYMLLVAQYNPVVFDEGITVTGFGTFGEIAQGLSIVGGVQSGSSKYADTSLDGSDPNITIKSGKVILLAFARGVDRTFTGTASITITGGTLCNLYLGSSSGTGGAVNMNISGGTFIYNVYSSAKAVKTTGNVHIRVTGGDFSAATLTRFDGSVTGEGKTAVLDVRGLPNYSTLVEKAEGFTEIITDEGSFTPGAPVSTDETFLYGSFTASDGTVLPYRYYLPAGYETSGKSYPVFLYMHGNGSRGSDNKRHLTTGGAALNDAVFKSAYECIMIAPQCPSAPNEWTLYNSLGKVNTYPGSEKYAEFLESGQPYGSRYFCAAVELLNHFLTAYPVDTSRIYLNGASNGSGAVWNMLALYPEVFAAAIPVAGTRAEPDFAHAVAHRVKDIPIWTFHGDQDGESGVPVEGTRAIVAALREIGGKITYTEVVGGNHSNIWAVPANTPGLVDWLFAQTNDSFVNTLSGAKGPALAAPANLSWDAHSAAWDAVSGAGAYKVTVYKDGAPVKTIFTPNASYTPDYTALGFGDYTFTVRAFPQSNANSIGTVSAESTAHTWNNLSAVDYNGDGELNLADALTLLRAAMDGTPLAGGDINGDGKIGVADVLRLLKRIAAA